jgi:cytosine/adenosine deaminase-related metal-dependent hydrolase
MDTSVWWSADLFAAMRATLSADRSREHMEAHSRQETVTNHHLRAENVVEFATRGGAKAIGRDDRLGALTPGRQADIVLIKNDDSPAMFPILNPYGHIVYQANRADVHTVMVGGKVVKRDGKLVGIDLAAARAKVGATVDHLRGRLGEEAWQRGMNPQIPESEMFDNPYQYSDFEPGKADEKLAE